LENALWNCSDIEFENVDAAIFDEQVKKQAMTLLSDYNPDDYRWEKQNGEQCEDCHEWIRWPAGQRHFGYYWARLCDRQCECGCHQSDDSILVGSVQGGVVAKVDVECRKQIL
jgi:hypothetical protein